jgi:hypothetical protein
MRNYTMPDGEALERVRPRSRAARRQFPTIGGLLALGVAVAACFAYLRYRTQQYREENWYSAIATVKDVRTKLVSETGSQYGGAMLYQVQVLASFPVNGSIEERWITVDQVPKSLDAIHFQEYRWKGGKYFVRWKPSDPDRIVIEIH